MQINNWVFHVVLFKLIFNNASKGSWKLALDSVGIHIY